MQLIRLASIELSRPAPPGLQLWTYESTSGVQVEILSIFPPSNAPKHSDDQPGLVVAWPHEKSTVNLAVRATERIGIPTQNGEGLLFVDEPTRIRLEAAIVELSDVLSVTYQCRRVVRSPVPCVAIAPEDASEIRALASAAGLDAPLTAHPRGRFLPDITDEQNLLSAIADRPDGMALLADALSEDSAVGRVQNLFRVFERAFCKGPKACGVLLLPFLRSGPTDLEWTEDEIADWFDRLRSEVTHADRRDTFARAADVERVLGRLEHAAYDVLLNKETWRTPDSKRRDAIALRAGTGADQETLRLRQPTTVIMHWSDPFGVFPVEFNLRPKFESPVVSKMPGYTHDDPKAFVARARILSEQDPSTPVIYEVTSWLGDGLGNS